MMVHLLCFYFSHYFSKIKLRRKIYFHYVVNSIRLKRNISLRHRNKLKNVIQERNDFLIDDIPIPEHGGREGGGSTWGKKGGGSTGGKKRGGEAQKERRGGGVSTGGEKGGGSI